MKRVPRREQLLEWVERVSMYLAQDGVPPVAGRVLGWLMICDPPEQPAGQIAEAIRASRASLTSSLRMLGAMGFVTRGTKPGERTVYYRLREGASQQVVRRQIASITTFCEITEDGISLLGSDTGRAARIQEAYDTFAWMLKVFDDAPPMPTRTPTESDKEA